MFPHVKGRSASLQPGCKIPTGATTRSADERLGLVTNVRLGVPVTVRSRAGCRSLLPTKRARPGPAKGGRLVDTSAQRRGVSCIRRRPSEGRGPLPPRHLQSVPGKWASSRQEYRPGCSCGTGASSSWGSSSTVTRSLAGHSRTSSSLTWPSSSPLSSAELSSRFAARS